jgi:hypothetical protein
VDERMNLEIKRAKKWKRTITALYVQERRTLTHIAKVSRRKNVGNKIFR